MCSVLLRVDAHLNCLALDTGGGVVLCFVCVALLVLGGCLFVVVRVCHMMVYNTSSDYRLATSPLIVYFTPLIVS